MENKTKAFRVFPWQVDFLIEAEGTGQGNNSFVMRNALSFYIIKHSSKLINKDQSNLLHFKARAIFEKKKRKSVKK